MRICIQENKQVELSTDEWLSAKKPEVVGCTDLGTQEPFDGLDWKADTQSIKEQLSKNSELLFHTADYVSNFNRKQEYASINYMASDTFKLLSLIMDWAFDNDWTGEVSNLKLQVDISDTEEEEELDAKKEQDIDLSEGLDLQKLKFTENGQDRTTEENLSIKPESEGEGFLIPKVGHREDSGSSESLQPKEGKKRRNKKRR